MQHRLQTANIFDIRGQIDFSMLMRPLESILYIVYLMFICRLIKTDQNNEEMQHSHTQLRQSSLGLTQFGYGV